MGSATMTTASTLDQQVELVDLLRRFETMRRDELAAVCGTAGDATRRLADRGQVPSYLVVEPQDPAPVVERTLLAALRRLTSARH